MECEIGPNLPCLGLDVNPQGHQKQTSVVSHSTYSLVFSLEAHNSHLSSSSCWTKPLSQQDIIKAFSTFSLSHRAATLLFTLKFNLPHSHTTEQDDEFGYELAPVLAVWGKLRGHEAQTGS